MRANERALLYSFIARMFLGIPPELAEDLSSGEFVRNLQPLMVNSEMEQGLAEIKEFSDKLRDPDKIKSQLEYEFNQLFVNPFGEAMYPYKGKYVDEDPSDLFLDLRRYFRDAGLKLSEDFSDRDDHVSLLMEFMGVLCQRQAEMEANGDFDGANAVKNVQKEFFRKHLLWVEDYCRRIEQSKDADFFKGFAKIVAGFLESEKVGLDLFSFE